MLAPYRGRMRGRTQQRTAWRLNWLRAISEAADVHMQRATWLNPENGNPHFSFTECASCYFDDLRLGSGYHAAVSEGLLTEQEAVLASEFHAVFARYVEVTSDQSDESVLADAKWLVVMEEAAMLKRKLLDHSLAEEERTVLCDRSIYALKAARTAGSA